MLSLGTLNMLKPSQKEGKGPRILFQLKLTTLSLGSLSHLVEKQSVIEPRFPSDIKDL